MSRTFLPIAICLACFTAPGCGANELESPTALRLRGLGVIFLDHAAARGDGPKDEETLKRHMNAVHESILVTNNVDPKDPKLFISDRDQQPFVFIWGTRLSFGMPQRPVLAHEATGKDGKRLVVFSDGEIELVDDERFETLDKGK